MPEEKDTTEPKSEPKPESKEDSKKLSMEDLNISVKDKESLKAGGDVGRPDSDRGH